jgi:hypothetical protein
MKEEDDIIEDEGGRNWAELLGAFGKHSNLEQRAKAERLAAMKPGDGRRKKGDRIHQLNVRINDSTKQLVDSLITKLSDRDGREWSKTELVEAAISSLAKHASNGAAA